MSKRDDEHRIRHVYKRREALSLLAGTSGALLLTACGGGADLGAISDLNATLATGCVVRPALSEGPIFVDDQANRSDIRADPSSGAVSEGAPLELTFNVSALAGVDCSSLEGAQVDVWQCDALGVYSDTDFNNMDTVGQKFLRGHQFTDSEGNCTFTTVYPGWYDGRAVHIHFKVRSADGYEFTSQLFFDPRLTDTVYQSAPYNTRPDRTVRNSDDGTATKSGDHMILDVQTAADGAGYAANFNVTLDIA